MSGEDFNPNSNEEAALEQEIRQGRKFSAREAVGRLAGPGAMKGGSAISRVQQAENAISSWLSSHVDDQAGALKLVLFRHLKGSEPLLSSADQPLVPLTNCLRQLLASDELLREVVREADVEWGRAMDERPFFEKDGNSHPDDPYTVQSVRDALTEAVKQLLA